MSLWSWDWDEEWGGEIAMGHSQDICKVMSQDVNVARNKKKKSK